MTWTENLELLWHPLLEAAGQVLVGAAGHYTFERVMGRFRQNAFDGAMDLWQRGIGEKSIQEGDAVHFDGLISPYIQLFPGDPLLNAQRWNGLYGFAGRISSAEYQAMEFYAGSDVAIRVGSLNGESVVGLYSRYGFVGEGIIGVCPTKMLLKAMPDFFHPDNIGARARVSGRLSRCPSQHGFVAQAIAQRAGVSLKLADYKNTWYLQVSAIRPWSAGGASTVSLLGSIWAATELPKNQYLVQYGYLNNPTERRDCIAQLREDKAWKKVRVYYDDIDCPSKELSFRRLYM